MTNVTHRRRPPRSNPHGGAIMRRLLLALTVMALITSACADTDADVETAAADADTTPLTSATSTSVELPQAVSEASPDESSVSVVEDVVYRSTEPVPWALDVYHSPVLEGGPVVVFFHGGRMDKSASVYESIGEAIAEQGGVMFVPDWDDSSFNDIAGYLANNDAAVCAVSYALAHAAEYGADPERLILAGHSGGAAIAEAAGGLRQVSPITDCVVEMSVIEADGLVVWDGDWLMGDPAFDRFGTDLPELIAASGPWSRLDAGPQIPVVLATASRTPDTYRRCGVGDPESPYWVRDPDDWYREQLGQLGMLDDGCIDIGKVQELLAQTMKAHGFDATHLILEDCSHVTLSDQGQAQLVDAILTITD